jgi:hypothetical protein
MVGIVEIETSVDMCLSETMEKVGNEGKQVQVLAGNIVESSVVDAEA